MTQYTVFVQYQAESDILPVNVFTNESQALTLAQKYTERGTVSVVCTEVRFDRFGKIEIETSMIPVPEAGK